MAKNLNPNPNPPPLTAQDDAGDEVSKVFNKFDANGDGKISAAEFGAVLTALGSPTAEDEVARAMSELDTDGDGSINLSEFRAFHCGGGGDAVAEMKEAFEMYDKDGDGKITAIELHAVLKCLGEKCTTKECEGMIGSYDVDGDGCINFDEFKKMMTKAAS
ncbi:probable calcium-binding protein CML18 [Andrographis paniculata]|uniref:probable calcium-binding protein CML18 n=1 Tax=Andrographis paniculata TaxID=175694 RepID=UPI0021E7B94C|nr:probable calcium-binding protein CML18 [Andrographis paniculata]